MKLIKKYAFALFLVLLVSSGHANHKVSLPALPDLPFTALTLTDEAAASDQEKSDAFDQSVTLKKGDNLYIGLAKPAFKYGPNGDQDDSGYPVNITIDVDHYDSWYDYFTGRSPIVKGGDVDLPISYSGYAFKATQTSGVVYIKFDAPTNPHVSARLKVIVE